MLVHLKYNVKHTAGPQSGGKILSAGPQTEKHTHIHTDTNTHFFKVHVMLQPMTKKCTQEFKSVKSQVCACRTRAAPVSILVPAAESLDLFRFLLFHVCVFCPNEFGCDKQIQAANAPFGPGESARRPGTNTNQVTT